MFVLLLCSWQAAYPIGKPVRHAGRRTSLAIHVSKPHAMPLALTSALLRGER